MNANLELTSPECLENGSHTTVDLDEQLLSELVHSRVYLEEGDFVQVDCNVPCEVILTSDSEFEKYLNGQNYDYQGGFINFYPVNLAPPHAGFWNIAIDLGEHNGDQVRYLISVVREP